MEKVLIAIFVSFTLVHGLDLDSLFKRAGCINKLGDSYCKTIEKYCSFHPSLKTNCAKTCDPKCRSAPINKCVNIYGAQCKTLASYCNNPKMSSTLLQYCAKTCDPACRSVSVQPTKPTNKCSKDKWYCATWKKYGFCTNEIYRDHVKKNCRNACGFCNTVTKTKTVIQPTQAPAGAVQVKVNVQECLHAHNDKRALHSADPLTWDAKLAKDAQDWAMHLANLGDLQHAKNTGQGENLASGWSSFGSSYTCEKATQSWYDEIKLYKYTNPGYSSATGHFTQVVWKSSKRLGVGIAKKGNWFYVVARYSPPGNVIGQFAANVGPLRHK